MQNQFNSAFKAGKQPLFTNASSPKNRIDYLSLFLCLTIIAVLVIGMTCNQLANQAIIVEIAQTHLVGTSISPALQKQLLLILLLASGMTALLVSAIALFAHRLSLSSSKPTNEKADLFGDIASQSRPMETKRMQLLADFTSDVRQSLKEKDIFNPPLEEVRNTLEADRVFIYRFNPDGKTGEITAQANSPEVTSVWTEKISNLFQEENFHGYKSGSLWVVHDVYEDNLTPAHSQLLESLQIKASIVAPILSGDRLVGLLCVHQCSDSRDWQQSEFYFLKQLAVQIGFALDQARLVAQLNVVSQQQQQQAESLQCQLISLVNDVEGVVKGDLTVRADVTEGEIGTVADFFNAVIESLRGIVSQVKVATTQVNDSLGEDEGAIRELAGVAFKQAQETTRTLDLIEQITHSIQGVAAIACHAAEVARTASATAQSSGEAMAHTVQKIMKLQETVVETANKVKHLGESSQQVSKVVSLINQIALQTNLLAVNAGIESARAGEERHSFGVVAKEVGELAVRCAAATQEIEEIVENILVETTQVVEAMELGMSEVVEGTDLVEDTKQSLARILEVSHQIEQLVASISIATVSQVKTSQEVTNLMKNMAEVSERTSKYSEQISSSLQQTVVVAQQLQASVEVFKVDESMVGILS